MNEIQGFFNDLFANKVLISTLIAWAIAQGLKILTDLIKGRFTAERLIGSGGMPSSHSATVASLAISAGIVEGFDSTVFVVALFLAIIVVYDAVGVRAECGKHAHILNQLHKRELTQRLSPSERGTAAGSVSEDNISRSNSSSAGSVYGDKPLKEKIGHTVPEVAAGLILGIAVACIMCDLVL